MKKQNLIAILTLVALAASVNQARAAELSPGSPTYTFDATNGATDANATLSSTGGSLTGVTFSNSQGAYGLHLDAVTPPATGTVSYTFTSTGPAFETLHLKYPVGFLGNAGDHQLIGTYSTNGGGSGKFLDQSSPAGNFKLIYEDQTITGINATSITLTWTEISSANTDWVILFASPLPDGSWAWSDKPGPSLNVPFTAQATFVAPAKP